MSIPTPAELLAFLEEHGFLAPPQAQQLGEGGPTKFADGQALARGLLDRNWLTPYQVNQLLQGLGTDLILGPYRLLDRLGEGGMGQVFKAHHVSMDRKVALKIIPRDLVSNALAVGRFYREVRAVAKLSHPNIVTAFEVNQLGPTHYLAMEFVNGIDLARLVQQSGPLPIPKACEYIRQAAAGLQHAHEKGLVHRPEKQPSVPATKKPPPVPPTPSVGDPSATQMRLEKAKEAYQTAVMEARVSLLRRFEELSKSFAAGENNRVASQLREDMKLFESQGMLFGRRPELNKATMEYGKALKRARDALALSYQEAIEEYTKLRKPERTAQLKAEVETLALNAPLVSVRRSSRNTYIQHANYLGWLKQVSSDSARLNATFELIPGLADAHCVSFRSVNLPNHFLVHGDFRVRLQPFENSDGFRQNGTFRRVRGLGAEAAWSFEAVNYPGYYIRGKGGALFIEKNDGTPQFRSDSTFVIVDPKYRLW